MTGLRSLVNTMGAVLSPNDMHISTGALPSKPEIFPVVSVYGHCKVCVLEVYVWKPIVLP